MSLYSRLSEYRGKLICVEQVVSSNIFRTVGILQGVDSEVLEILSLNEEDPEQENLWVLPLRTITGFSPDNTETRETQRRLLEKQLSPETEE